MPFNNVMMQAIFHICNHEKNILREPSRGESYIPEILNLLGSILCVSDWASVVIDKAVASCNASPVAQVPSAA